jgi:hypothetical protein
LSHVNRLGNKTDPGGSGLESVGGGTRGTGETGAAHGFFEKRVITVHPHAFFHKKGNK